MSESPSIFERVEIRPARREDAGGYLKLVDALAQFENLAPPDTAAKMRLIDHLFGNHPRYRLLVAVDAEEVVGYAVHFLTYSTFLARPTLYLEDIFLLPEYRGQGLGHRIVTTLARTAVAEGCGRMDFLVLEWEKEAREFYRRHGVECQEQWMLHRLEGDELERCAALE